MLLRSGRGFFVRFARLAPALFDHRGFPVFHCVEDFILRAAHRGALQVPIDLETQILPSELVRHQAADTLECTVPAGFLNSEEMTEFFGLAVPLIATKHLYRHA